MEGRKSGIAWTLAGVSVAVLLGYLLFRQEEDGVITLGTVVDPLVRGARLNHSTLNDDGIVYDPAPSELLGEASEILGIDLDEDTYALARSGRSEGVDGMEARMHVMLTQSAEAGLSVFQLTVRESQHPDQDGYYGEQLGRRWASSRDPYAGDVALAQRVIAERAQGIDPTGGAGRFFDKSGFGKQSGTIPAWQSKLADWAREGFTGYYYPRASKNFVLFRRGGAPQGFALV